METMSVKTPALSIKPLASDADLEKIWPLLARLYSSLDIRTLRARLQAVKSAGWRCAGLFAGEDDSEGLVALAGYWITTRFCYGKYLYVDHFIVADHLRRAGLGRTLLTFLHDTAQGEGCERIVLDTFVANDSAHRFWFDCGFKIVGFHFGKSLRGE
jgi:GNAT superfamily N-acetyltransferase